VFWGAGSSGVELANTLGREPQLWTDGNPAKVGKRFVGLDSTVVSPATALAALRGDAMPGAALVITSSFAAEILPRVRQMGWTGDVFDSAGSRL
jgi:hypothetical protein